MDSYAENGRQARGQEPAPDRDEFVSDSLTVERNRTSAPKQKKPFLTEEAPTESAAPTASLSEKAPAAPSDAALAAPGAAFAALAPAADADAPLRLADARLPFPPTAPEQKEESAAPPLSAPAAISDSRPLPAANEKTERLERPALRFRRSSEPRRPFDEPDYSLTGLSENFSPPSAPTLTPPQAHSDAPSAPSVETETSAFTLPPEAAPAAPERIIATEERPNALLNVSDAGAPKIIAFLVGGVMLGVFVIVMALMRWIIK